MKLTPVLVDAATRREQIRNKAIEGIKDVFPIKTKQHTVDVENIHVKPTDFSSREQKEALLQGNTLQEPLRADLVLKDNEGKVIARKKHQTLAQLPFFTQRHTFIVGGNEYSVAHQRRVRPGVYTRVRGNEELEAAFNLGKGENFRINMDPAKGHMYLQYGSTNIPLYPVLKHMGISDKELTHHWGSGVVSTNRETFKKKEEQAVNKLYERLVSPYQRTAKTSNEMAGAIASQYQKTMLDPDVTEKTLGQRFTHVDQQALLKASQKLLDVHRKGIDTDDRDSLAFQALYGVDDFIKERIQLEGRNLHQKARMRASTAGREPTLERIIPTSPFTKALRGFVTNAALSAIPTQINPMEILDSAVRVTNLGEGGISSERAVPSEARNLHHTHFGVIDPSRSPESFKAGIDLRTSLWTKRDDQGRMYTLMRNMKSGKLEDVSVQKLENATIAFHGEGKKRSGASALRNGQLLSVPGSQIDYELPHPTFLFSPASNTVPMPESSQGNRIIMASKHSTQALPLIEREEPLIQVESFNPGRTFEQELADLIVPVAPMSGVIKKIDRDYIYLQPESRKAGSHLLSYVPLVAIEHVSLADENVDGEKFGAAPLIKIPYDDNFPLSSKTYLHNNVIVKPGDYVEANQHLADSNYTRNGKLALGRNLNTGYMAYYGMNSNDAVVMSETGAKKLTSEHMYKEALPLDSDTVLDKKKHQAYFGSRWTTQQYNNLDAQGVAKSGTIIQPGDPLVLSLYKTAPTPDQQMLGRLHKTLATPYREITVIWDHRNEGEVVDVLKTANRVLLTVKTKEAAAVGDKLSGRFGNKGVISKIIPDNVMVRTQDGQPLDLLMTSAGIVSRVNPAQIIETAVSKVAKKTGKPIAMPSMSGRNNVAWAKKLLKEHNLSDKEILFNPVTNKEVKGPDGKGVMTGQQYIYKLFKSTETNYAARGVEDYDINLQPAKGGSDGAKSIGRMEINGFLAHNARNVLREAATLKSSRNDEWWRAYQLGLPLPPMRRAFAYDKFINMLKGAGVKIDKSNEQLFLGPMTDNDITKLSSGALKKATMVREKDMAPEKDGLFDPVITGGTSGNRWSHVNLSEPIVNPTFEDPVRRMLGVTVAQFRQMLQKEGGEKIRQRLRDVDLKQKKEFLEARAQKATGTALNDVVKQLKTINSLERQGLKPDEAFVLTKLPVVPPVIRPILPSRGKRDLLIADANYLYRDTMLANDTLNEAKKFLPENEVGDARLHLYDATKAVFGLGDAVSPQLKGRGAKGFITTIAGQGSPKRGFFHGKVLKRSQDLTGRGTIAPDLTLNMDEVGLPEDMLWKTYEPHLMRKLVQGGYKALDARNMIADKHPKAHEVLLKEIQDRPVVINRAPTLHRFGLIGAYAKPVPGRTIRINPFMEEPLGADYDGDSVDCALDCFINGCYTYLHIVNFPRMEASKMVKDNKEYYNVPENIQVFSYDEELKQITLKPVTGFSVHHNLEMLEVKLLSGRKIKVSRDASLFVLNPETQQLERRCAENAIGLATPRPRFLHRTIQDGLGTLTFEAGWFIGALTGNGWLMYVRGRLTGVGFASIHEPLRHRFTAFAENLVTSTVSRRDYKSPHEFMGYECYSEKMHLNCAELGRYLNGFGLTYRNAKEKFLPPCFVKAPREFLLGLLSGLLDTDGSITQIKAKAKKNPQWMINYSTSSQQLADHIALLATLLKVRSNVCYNAPKDSYAITFSMPDLVKIAPELSLSNPNKITNLERMQAEFNPNEPNNFRGDCVPVTKEVCCSLNQIIGCPSKTDTPARKEAKLLYSAWYKAIKDKRISRAIFNRTVTYLGMRNVREIMGEDLFNHASNEAILWDFVEKAELLPGRHTAWDLTVPGSCTFMTANQVVVYDTVQVHVPVTDAAVQDVKAMTLSNQLFGDKTKSDLMVFPQHEAILGIHTASAAKDGKTYTFKNTQEALTAYKRGKINLNDTIKIGKK
ncbi:MAG: LAGLIDADG family homing endonuclease [Desulfobacteraceae bacterium]|jgi:DNA-directed RNA polymerase beta subunit